MIEHKNTPPPIEVPIDQLTPDALSAVIDSFILREGTDYGVEEISHESKVARIQKQLKKGDIKLVFDSESESVTFMKSQDWAKLNAR